MAAVRTEATVGAEGTRFFEPAYELQTGLPEDAARGLQDRMRVDPAAFYTRLAKGVDGIEEEALEFAARSPVDGAQLCEVVDYVLNQQTSEKAYPNGIRDQGRGSVRPTDFTSHPRAQEAGLSEVDVLSLRVYTSIAFRYMNNPLRDDDRHARRDPVPLPALTQFANDAIRKLRVTRARAEEQRVVVWRGMRNRRLSGDFMRMGGTELAFMSTTRDLSVAARYALSQDSLLLKIVAPSFMSLGTDLRWLSMFPGEDEVVFPPLTYLRPTGRTDRVDAADADGRPVAFTVIEVTPYM